MRRRQRSKPLPQTGRPPKQGWQSLIAQIREHGATQNITAPKRSVKSPFQGRGFIDQAVGQMDLRRSSELTACATPTAINAHPATTRTGSSNRPNPPDADTARTTKPGGSTDRSPARNTPAVLVSTGLSLGWRETGQQAGSSSRQQPAPTNIRRDSCTTYSWPKLRSE